METKVGYKAKAISDLPLKMKHSGGPALTVNYMREDQFRPGYEFVQEAARRGDNVGMDEFSDMDVYTFLIRISHCFVVQYHGDDTDKIRAMLLILPDNSGRSLDFILAEIRVFLSADIWVVSPNILRDLIRLGERLVVDLDLGYLASVVNVAIPCSKWIHTLKDEGYLIVVTLPRTVDHMGRGLVESCKLYKRLVQGTRPKRPYDVIVRMAKQFLEIPNDEEFTRRELPVFQCLPLHFQFKSGKEVILRNQRHEDDLTLYNLFVDATKSGQGFGSDEMPGIGYFHFEFMMHYKICVLEDVESKAVVGAVLVGPSALRRTRKVVVAETMTILHPNYRRKGLGVEMIQIGMGLLREEGLLYVLNDSILTNVPVQSLISTNPMFEIIPVGFLPMASHVTQYGYVDSRYEFCTVKNMKPIRQLCLERMPVDRKSKI